MNQEIEKIIAHESCADCECDKCEISDLCDQIDTDCMDEESARILMAKSYEIGHDNGYKEGYEMGFTEGNDENLYDFDSDRRILDIIGNLKDKTNFLFAARVKKYVSKIKDLEPSELMPNYTMPNIEDGYWFDYIKREAKKISGYYIEEERNRTNLKAKGYAMAIVKYVKEVYR